MMFSRGRSLPWMIVQMHGFNTTFITSCLKLLQFPDSAILVWPKPQSRLARVFILTRTRKPRSIDFYSNTASHCFNVNNKPTRPAPAPIRQKSCQRLPARLVRFCKSGSIASGLLEPPVLVQQREATCAQSKRLGHQGML